MLFDHLFLPIVNLTRPIMSLEKNYKHLVWHCRFITYFKFKLKENLKSLDNRRGNRIVHLL